MRLLIAVVFVITLAGCAAQTEKPMLKPGGASLSGEYLEPVVGRGIGLPPLVEPAPRGVEVAPLPAVVLVSGRPVYNQGKFSYLTWDNRWFWQPLGGKAWHELPKSHWPKKTTNR